MAEMSDSEYLKRHGIMKHLAELTTLVLENRPEDPVLFATEYLDQALQPKQTESSSYRLVTSSPKSLDAFLENIAAAYALLEDQAQTEGAPEGFLVCGRQIAPILARVCSDFPDDMRAVVFAALNKRDVDPVTLAEFSAALRACLSFKDVLTALRALFGHMANDRGRAPAPDVAAALKRAVAVVPSRNRGRASQTTSDDAVIQATLEVDSSGSVRFDSVVRCCLQLLSHRL